MMGSLLIAGVPAKTRSADIKAQPKKEVIIDKELEDLFELMNFLKEKHKRKEKERTEEIEKINKTKNIFFEENGESKLKIKMVYIDNYNNPYWYKPINLKFVHSTIKLGVQSLLWAMYDERMNYAHISEVNRALGMSIDPKIVKELSFYLLDNTYKALKQNKIERISGAVNYLVLLNQNINYKDISDFNRYIQEVYEHLFDNPDLAESIIKVEVKDRNREIYEAFKNIESKSLGDMMKHLASGYTTKEDNKLTIKEKKYPLFPLVLSHEIGHLLNYVGYTHKINLLKMSYWSEDKENKHTIQEEMAAYLMEVIYVYSYRNLNEKQKLLQVWNAMTTFVEEGGIGCEHIAAASSLIDFLKKSKKPLNLTALYKELTHGKRQNIIDSALKYYDECIEAELFDDEKIYGEFKKMVDRADKVIRENLYVVKSGYFDKQTQETKENVTQRLTRYFLESVRDFENYTGIRFKDLYRGIERLSKSK